MSPCQLLPKPRLTYDVAPEDIPRLIKKLRKEMKTAAERYDFERAAELRDRIFVLQERELDVKEA